ncbi:MAG: VCBS domain-containing protein, partial [Desulfovibrio sp.]|nr:VCBS domain-containing protein [Desulfovibrio sp.]
TLTVIIDGTNDAPQVSAAAATINEDQASVSGSLPLPTDIDAGDAVNFLPQTNAPGLYGIFTLQANGTYTYSLNNALPAVQQLSVGAQLTESFTFVVTDQHGTTASNTITVTIRGTNDAPQISAATAGINEDQASISGTLPVPTDVDAGDSPQFVPQTNPGLYGTFTLQADGSYAYSLNNALPAVQQLGVGAQLTETFTYTVFDGHGGTDTNSLTVTINGTNDAPQVSASFAFIQKDEADVSGTLPTPTDVDAGDSAQFVAQANPGLYGTFTLQPDGSYAYSLNNALPVVQALTAGQQLTETFTYTVTDQQGATASNTITITIRGTNGSPQVSAATAAINEDDASVSGTLPAPNDRDEGDIVEYVPQTSISGLYGVFSLQPDGSYTYTLNNTLSVVQQLAVGQQLNETFAFTVMDQHGLTASNILTITINGTNDAPQVSAATTSIYEDSVSANGILPAASDVDAGDSTQYVPQTNAPGLYGVFTLQANGTYTYSLNNALPAVQQLGVGAQLNETFTYTVTDQHGATATNTLTVTIRGTNDAPQVSAAAAAINEDQASVSGSLPLPTDIDTGDAVNFLPQTNVPGLYGTFTLLANGTYTYSLNNALPVIQQLGVGQQLTETFT